MKIVFLDDKFVNWEDAKIHIASLGFTLGASVFEACRVNWNKGKNAFCIFRLRDHINRLFCSLKILRMSINYSKRDIENIVCELIKKWSAKQHGYIRITVYVSDPAPGSSVYCPNDVHTNLCITLTENEWPKEIFNGIHCCISSWTRISDNCMPPRVKSACNYENTRLAGHEAKLNGYDNAILLNQAGKVSEAAESAIFFIDTNQNLITPDVNSDILCSITRDTVMQIWKSIFKKQPIEKCVDRTELYLAEEVFLCNTAKLIRPVLSIDKINISKGIIGEMTKAVRDDFFNVIIGNNESFSDYYIII